MAATAAMHFGFGTAAGTAYGLVEKHLPGPPVARGVLFGLGVWAASYMGWLPAMDFYPSATEQSARHNALMIGAHMVWGSTLGLLEERLEQ